MVRCGVSIINYLIWGIFLQTVVALAVQKLPTNHAVNLLKYTRSAASAKNLYEQYTLGHKEAGAHIIYIYQYTQNYNEKQEKISLDFNYPIITDDNAAVEPNDYDSSTIITQIQLYLEAENGSDTQAYINDGGIGENNISLQINATNSEFLTYMLVIYGKPVDDKKM